MPQSKEELERWYEIPDPWGYTSNLHDWERKKRILKALEGKRFERALDIGCGEGFITKDLPAFALYGLEASDNAKSRVSPNVTTITQPEGKYGLIIATGVLYSQYDWRSMLDLIKAHACGTILTSHIKDWEMPEIAEILEIADQIHEEEFPYREYMQKLRVFEIKDEASA